ncbi:hypothetical protein [Gilliamella bombi]|uniref:hypothetical protein n=1 Tax=Gilliamella bombi TaxID=1908521 RepID=UPI000A1677FC|nr:hypothetical protein [Gilliamella bombi]
MTAENKANFVVNLTGNVAQKAKSFGSAISQMGKSGSRSMRLMSSAMSASNKILDKFDNKFVGFATGGGLVMAAKRVGDWQQQLTELGTRYNLTAEQSDDFLNTVYATGAAYKMPYSDVITALDKMLERTNDVSGSISNVDNIAKAIKGLGLNADEAGAHVAQLMNKGFTSDNINKLFNGVASASKIGTGDIKEQLAGMIELTKDTQWQSPEQLMQMLAIQRLSDSYIGNSADAAAAMQSFGKSIKDKQVQRVLRDNGINVYSDKDKTQFKDPAQLLLEIGNRAKFKDHNLKTIFPENLIKTTKAFADSEQQQKLLGGVKIEDGLLEEKASKNINTFNGALTSLTNAGERWAQLKLAKPIQELADAINSLTPEQLDEYTSKLETGAKIIGGAIAARYAYRGYKSIKNVLSGGKGKLGNAVDSAISSADATPVYVTNWDEQKGGRGFGGNGNSGGINPLGGNLLKQFALTQQIYEASRLTEDKVKDLPDDDKRKQLFEYVKRTENEPESFYDDGNTQSWLGSVSPALDNSMQNVGKTLNNAITEVSESLSGAMEKIGEAIRLPFGVNAKHEQQTIKGTPPSLTEKSEIVLKIESSDGLTVKTKSISAADTDIVVNTGKTYGRGGGMY